MEDKILWYCLLIFIGSCTVNSGKEIPTSSFKGSIIAIEIDHVVNKRDWCRMSTIYFDLLLENIYVYQGYLHSDTLIEPCKLSLPDAQ